MWAFDLSLREWEKRKNFFDPFIFDLNKWALIDREMEMRETWGQIIRELNDVSIKGV